MPKLTPEPPGDRAKEIMEMLAKIPIDALERATLELLGATRWVNMGRDNEPKKEPDNQVRLRVLELIVEQSAGAAGTRKPIDPASNAGAKDKPTPGLLKAGKRPV